MDVNRVDNPAANAAASDLIRQSTPETRGNRTAPAAAAPDSAPASIIVQQEFPPNTRLFLDEENNRIVAQVLDENNEVVRQIPPQELLEISARFNRLEGILFDEQR